MDPISIIGLAGSIVSIVDVVTKSLKALNELRLRWLEADLTLMLLITQLGTLKAALGQIAEWINSCLAADPHQHYQLIIDLGNALSCCKTLITLMDRHISKLEWNDHIDQPISFERRVRVALKDGAIKDCLNHLGNQTNALNLLLTAFNCRNQSEQRALLKKKKSRKIFEQIRDDSSSLAVLYDSASFITGLTNVTETSSKLSLKFRFDGELLRSKIYQATVRSLLRRAIYGSNGSNVVSESAQSFSQPVLLIRDANYEPFSLDFTNTDSFAAMNPQLPLGPPNYAHTAAVDSHGFSNPFQNQAIQMSSFPPDSRPPPALERRQSAPPALLAQHIPVPMPPPPPPPPPPPALDHRFTNAYGSADQGRYGRLLNFLEEIRQSAPLTPPSPPIPVLM